MGLGLLDFFFLQKNYYYNSLL